jgi:RecA-family ATPase
MLDLDTPITEEEIERARKKSSQMNNIYKIDYELHSFNAANLQPTLQPWLWEGYIPLDTCTLLAGTGGIGKSQFLTWLASIVSNGAKFSINGLDYKIDQGKVIILSAEDHITHTIIPRLIAAKAKRENIEIITSAIDIKTKVNERFIALDQDILLLEEKIKVINQNNLNVKFISIDPITAYLGNVRENRSAEVRNFILRLKKLAEKYNLAIMLNTHTRKSNGNGEGATSAADEIMGSIAWSNTVRQAFAVTRHHDDDNLIVLTASKTNYKKPESIAYRIKEFLLEIEGKNSFTSAIEWHNGKVDLTANEAVNKKAYEERKETELAKNFILQILAFGNKPYEEIKRMAEGQGINVATLKLARQKLSQEGTEIIMEPSPTDKRKMIWYIGTGQK